MHIHKYKVSRIGAQIKLKCSCGDVKFEPQTIQAIPKKKTIIDKILRR